MGNQNTQTRRISSESAPEPFLRTDNNGLSLSAGPSPQRVNHKFTVKPTNIAEMMNEGKLESPDRPRRHSDAAKTSSSRSPSPSPKSQSRNSHSNTVSPKVRRRNQPATQDTPTSNGRPRTPRLGFKIFQTDFSLSFMNLGGRRSRRPSGDQEIPLSFKIPEGEVDNSPLIPRDEIFEPLSPDVNGSDPKSAPSSGFRPRASTISNGHMARLNTLDETQEISGGKSSTKRGTLEDQSKRTRPSKKKKIPTVFRYYLSKIEKPKIANGETSQPKQVFIVGTMTSWRAVQMVKPKGDLDFVIIIDCHEGDHYFKFCVDGTWKIDEHQEKVTGRNSVMANKIQVKKSDSEVLEALACDSFVVKASKADQYQAQKKWGQTKPKWDSNKRGTNITPGSRINEPPRGPPFLPPQLLNSILNKDVSDNSDPILVPEPTSHVMVNHLYAQSVKDNVLVMATTTRFRKKYATVVLYKPID